MDTNDPTWVPPADQQGSLNPETLHLLLQGASDLLADAHLQQVLVRVLELAKALLPADAYAIWRTDATHEHWHTIASAGLSGDYSFEIDSPSESKMSDEPIAASNVQSSPRLRNRFPVYEREGIVSLLAVPLKFAGEPRGTLCFYFRNTHQFTRAEIDGATLLANISASAIASSEMYEEQSNERLRLEFLANAGEMLASSLDFATTLRQVAALAVPAIADWCSVYTYTDGFLENIATAHQDPAKLVLAEEYRTRFPETVQPGSRTERLLTLGEPSIYPVIPEELIDSLIKDPDQLEFVRQLGIRSVIEVPIVVRKSVIGMLRLVSAESRRIFNERDLKLAQELGRRAGTAIDNAKIYQALGAQQIEQRRILDALPSLIAVVDQQQRHQFANRAYYDC